MEKKDISEIKGVWTSEEIASIRTLLSSGSVVKEVQKARALAVEQSKEIQKIAHVDLQDLKVPFSFNL